MEYLKPLKHHTHCKTSYCYRHCMFQKHELRFNDRRATPYPPTDHTQPNRLLRALFMFHMCLSLFSLHCL